MSIIAEAPGFLQVFSDGLVKRFAPEIAPASLTSSDGYKSKDVTIDHSKGTTGRIFLPDSPSAASSNHLLPVLVYFHGGGFCIGSTTWLGYHSFLGDFSVSSQSIVLSIDYRLAPENRLPIAYDDCFSSLNWLTTQINNETWFARADLSRVFLSGDSAGGNIAHHVAIKAIRNKINVEIKGLLSIHPYFGSEKRTQMEKLDESSMDVTMNDMFWNLSIPNGFNRDYFGCNFEMAELSINEWSRFPAVVVYVAELDFLRERGELYTEFLKKKGVRNVELIEARGERHVYHVFDPKSESSLLLQKQMSEFMKSF